MQMFSSRKQEPPSVEPARSPVTPEPTNRASAAPAAKNGGLLSSGVSIKGTVKFNNELLIDGTVEGKIQSTGILSIGEHAKIQGEIRTKSVKVRGTVEGNIFATERCELQAGCTLNGDIESPRLIVDENAAFLGSAKVGIPK